MLAGKIHSLLVVHPVLLALQMSNKMAHTPEALAWDDTRTFVNGAEELGSGG